MRKIQTAVIAFTLLLIIGCLSSPEKTASNTVDLSKIIIQNYDVEDVTMFAALEHLSSLVNKKLPADKHIIFSLQADPNNPSKQIRWISERKDGIIFDENNQEIQLFYDDNFKRLTILPSISDKPITLQRKNISLREVLDFFCKHYKIKYKQEGNQILLYDPAVLKLANSTICGYPKKWIHNDKFHKTIAEADRIVIRDGGFGCCRNVDDAKIFFQIKDIMEIKKVYSKLKFQRQQYFSACGCCGYPGIDWYKGDKRIALTALKHGKRLKWKGFSTPEALTDESSKWLVAWLVKHGVNKKKYKLGIKETATQQEK
jgi:hypothetical protein